MIKENGDTTVMIKEHDSDHQGDHLGQQWAVIISENGEEGVYYNFNHEPSLWSKHAGTVQTSNGNVLPLTIYHTN